MQPTTPHVIRRAFVQRIKAIAPSFPEYRDCRWHYVPKLSEVPSPHLRNFTLQFSVSEEVLGGIYGNGIQRSFECRVWTSYMSLGSDKDDSIISEDAHDLHVYLSELAESTGSGLIAVRPLDWEDEETEEGHRYGAHVFEVHYLAPDPLPIIPNP